MNPLERLFVLADFILCIGQLHNNLCYTCFL